MALTQPQSANSLLSNPLRVERDGTGVTGVVRCVLGPRDDWFDGLHDEHGSPLHVDTQAELIRRMTQPVGLPAALDDDARIAVIGTGTIGASWAALFLAAGHDVAASDPAEGAEARLRAQVAANWGDLAALGVAKGPVESALERLTFHADPAEAARGVVRDRSMHEHRLTRSASTETIITASNKGLSQFSRQQHRLPTGSR